MLNLSTPIQHLKGVGPKYSQALNSFGIHTVEDLLCYKPFRYEDRTNFKPINALREGQFAVVQARVVVSGIYATPKKRIKIFEMSIADESGLLNVKFFNQPYLKSVLREGQWVIVYGRAKLDEYKLPQLCFINPEFELFEADRDASIHTGRVVPIYRRLGELSTRFLRKLIYSVLEDLTGEFVDPLPEYLKEKYSFLPRREAILNIHFPKIVQQDPLSRVPLLEEYNDGSSPAHKRLIFDELFQFQVVLNYMKRLRNLQSKNRAYILNDRVREAIKRMLPFHPTQAQKRALKEIVDDLCSLKPMNRLLQGDVGCGKTIVALQAIVIAIENSYQTALMAPTEILAEQHYLNVKRWFEKTNYRLALLTGSTNKSMKTALREQIAAGSLDLVIGTHAIIQEGIAFKSLGLIVIDEQHRFGVLQRADLIQKGCFPDTLVMTATPIPRSLALTLYGDLDISVIDELPVGRTPVQTILRSEKDRRGVYEILRAEIMKGHQIYIVYPLVERSEKLDLKAAKQMAAHLSKNVFPTFKIGLLHGRMKPQEKDEIMGRFVAGDLQILVSTTVIEVGVDVPNATVIVIEHAERFGLAQLHQLRGRVGRGRSQSICILVANNLDSHESQKRLEVMCQTSDGFAISELDLELRGPGEFSGTKQSGLPEFQFANLIRDRELLELARNEAADFLRLALTGKDDRLRETFNGLVRAWERRIGLVLVG